jgi:hypothetical protein
MFFKSLGGRDGREDTEYMPRRPRRNGVAERADHDVKRMPVSRDPVQLAPRGKRWVGERGRELHRKWRRATQRRSEQQKRPGLGAGNAGEAGEGGEEAQRTSGGKETPSSFLYNLHFLSAGICDRGSIRQFQIMTKRSSPIPDTSRV